MTKTATKTDAKDAAADHIPDVPDDAPESAARAAPVEAREERDEGDAPPPAGLERIEDDARARAAARYRELRDGKAAEAKTAAQEADPAETAAADDGAAEDDGASDAPAGEEAPAVAARPAPAAAAAEPAEPEQITLIVDGKPVKKTLSEVAALAQITVAGDNRFEEAKRLLKEVRELHGARPANQRAGAENAQDEPDPSQVGTEPEHRPAKTHDPVKLRQIVERIQVGDADEGAQAAAELLELASGANALDAGAVDRIVQQRLDQNSARQETSVALASFAAKYPQIAKDEDLADAGRSMLRREIIADLESAGIDSEAIKPIRDNLTALVTAQRDLRLKGHQVRSAEALLDTVGTKMTEKFKLTPATAALKPAESPQPKPRVTADPADVQQRVAAKRAAPQQPRSTGVRGQVNAAPPPKTKRDIINKMREARGFAVTK